VNTNESVKVTSDVGRDLLASANNFSSEERAVWEYVSNSLDCADDNTPLKIYVAVNSKQKSIEIQDNARGMSVEDLNTFFQMHAENIDRKHGRTVRGRWGTGKSAAFGIGNVLRVDTRRNGYRNVLELRREDLMPGQTEIPVRHVVRNEQGEFSNGTTIVIEDIFLPKLRIPAIVDYIERHLQTYRDLRAEVAVGTHVCKYREPAISAVYSFIPNQSQATTIGDVELTIKVACAPLPDIEQGIAITSGAGNLLAIETAGIEAKELGGYIFGSIDVPALEEEVGPIEVIDSSRSLRLNTNHPVARALVVFLGAKLEEVRRAEIEKKRAAEKNEEQRRLATQARKIEQVINDDFESVMDRLLEIRSATARPGKLGSMHGSSAVGGEDDDIWIEGILVPGMLLDESKSRGEQGSGALGRPDPMVRHGGLPNENGTRSVDPAGGRSGKRRRPRGSFRVRYDKLGEDEPRSDFDRQSLEILINLQHPVVRGAYRKAGGNEEDPTFVRLTSDIAFTEYALRYGNLFLEKDPSYPGDDLISIIKDRLDQVVRRAVHLYR